MRAFSKSPVVFIVEKKKNSTILLSQLATFFTFKRESRSRRSGKANPRADRIEAAADFR